MKTTKEKVSHTKGFSEDELAFLIRMYNAQPIPFCQMAYTEEFEHIVCEYRWLYGSSEDFHKGFREVYMCLWELFKAKKLIKKKRRRSE